MKALRDNIYEVLESLDATVARQWRQDYQSPCAFATQAQELHGLINYFFTAFSGLQGDFTRELNCITGNARNWDCWLYDFRRVVGPSFVAHAQYVFAPRRDISQNISELGNLLGSP